ncbi:MAG: trypsin-like peptidase domain-containing protein [Akkermansia sp.]
MIDRFLRQMLFSVCLCFLGSVAVAISHAAPESLSALRDVQEQVKKVSRADTRATVALLSDRGDTGSGVIVSKDGLILTAAHVIQGDEMMRVILPDGRMCKGKVLGADYTRDAAMVQMMDKGPWDCVEIGDSDQLSVGDFVVALGHAKGFDPGRRAPIRLGRMNTDGKQRFMISECTLIGGDSGGPLFDLKGRLVGIHSSIGPLLKVNNHVPVNVFKESWDRLVRGEQWGQLGMNPMADPNMPVIGFSMASARGRAGIIVQDVLVNSPADQAGLQAGDLIVSMGERQLATPKDMFRELGRRRPGEKVDLKVLRNGQAYKATLTLGRRSDLVIPLAEEVQP